MESDAEYRKTMAAYAARDVVEKLRRLGCPHGCQAPCPFDRMLERLRDDR